MPKKRNPYISLCVALQPGLFNVLLYLSKTTDWNFNKIKVMCQNKGAQSCEIIYPSLVFL